MSDGTHIEWTDATLNVVNGCSVVSPGCTNCYAMRLAGTRLKHHPSRAGLTIDTKAGPVWTGEVRFNEAALLQPLRWRRPRKIFWNAHGDLFHEAVPDEWIDRCFAVMALTPHHVHQVLTKRPERMREYVQAQAEGSRRVTDHVDEWETKGLIPKHIDTFRGWVGSPNRPRPLPSVWLGVSVEDQKRADERIPVLLDTPAAVRWLSCEPLLGPVDLLDIKWPVERPRFPETDDISDARSALHIVDGSRIDWIVAGGESGPGARPMHPDWARSLRDQCADAGVPFLFKQWGEWAPIVDDDDIRHVRKWVFPPNTDMMAPGEPREFGGRLMHRPGKKEAGRLLDGVQHDGYPA